MLLNTLERGVPTGEGTCPEHQVIFGFHKFVPERLTLKNCSFEEVIGKQIELYPLMEMNDLYKLVYQGVMGSGHAVSSTEKAREWLLREIEDPGEGSDRETLIEEISPGGTIIRVNLRPFLCQQRDPESLLRAFVRTGRECREDPGRIEEAWRAAESVQREFSADQMRAFISIQRETGFHAVHHSKRYRDLYRPAYRVALKALCIEEGVFR